ncbi:hypothetical protein SAMN05192574_11645 [Mucilaginibacter gossypiicola]|uniref:Uncharacterized protein n=1 Tax=Mucilaginibacter gossypiicola TaxID=551995 RepID=A0A1H8TM35_9SPHI|nr:hypothetical protein [Mucilaginibacter gossypiicola]SEO91876.1 hypothetical protein SAMN05192574_11645 [Mucilaginibacter gossypiicola]
MNILKRNKHTINAFAFAILMISLLGCKGNNRPKATENQTQLTTKVSVNQTTDTTKDKQEIQKLIRNLLVWAEDGNKVPDLLPFVINRQDSIVIGFDLSKLQGIDDSLKTTNFFSSEFVNNYNQIIQTLARKMKDKEIKPFSTGEIPPFGFHTDTDPWCDCQDVPYDGENAFSIAANLVDVHIIELNKERGKMYWTWGSLPKNVSPDWRSFTYKFNVIKEGGKWKISYLEGFDIKRA